MNEHMTYRRSLYNVFYIHILMFFIIIAAGMMAKSAALIADAADFIGDAANYALSIYVLNKSVKIKAFAAILKAITILFFASIFVYGLLNSSNETVPNNTIMALSGVGGIIAHAFCIYFLIQFRQGDSNLFSVWICTINDLVCNALTILGATLVGYFNSKTPDIIIAIIIVALAFLGACAILSKAINEIRSKDVSINS